MNESPQELTQPPEASAAKQGVDWVTKHWARVRLAHEGMMLEKLQRQNRIVEITARNTMTGKVDDVDGWPESEGEKMGVDIGDHITHNYHAKPRASLLKTAALAAAFSGMGGGIGVAVPWLLGMFDKTPPPVVAPPGEEWTDRVLENYVPPQGGSE